MSYEMKIQEEKYFSREEGRKEGRDEGRDTTLYKLVKDGLLTIKNAAKSLGLSDSELRKGYEAYISENA